MGDRCSQYAHRGKMGDVVYSLPVIRHRGGMAILHFSDSGEWRVAEAFALLAPLLEAQAYLSVVDCQEPRTPAINLDLFRIHPLLFCQHLKYTFCDCFNVPHAAADTPWLVAPSPRSVSRVLICRSLISHGLFHWPGRLSRYAKEAAFVGLPREYDAFKREMQVEIPFLQTATLLDAANVIAGAEVFVGNQSVLLALAEGLGISCEVETVVPLAYEGQTKPRDAGWEGKVSFLRPGE
jgi:hypothetical protein